MVLLPQPSQVLRIRVLDWANFSNLYIEYNFEEVGLVTVSQTCCPCVDHIALLQTEKGCS